MSCCNTCGNVACTCDDGCGCLHQITSNCVFYNGANLDCINVTKGDTLDEVLLAINSVICDLPDPSGYPTYVGTSGEITVVGNVIGLDSAITSELSDHTSQISTLQACCDASVKQITTSTPTYISIDNGGYPYPDGSVNISYLPPTTPSSAKQGIIKNLTSSTTLTSGDSVITDFSSYVPSVGDVIRFYGAIRRDNSPPQTSTETYVVTDGTNSITMVSNGGSTAIAGYAYSLDEFQIELEVISNIAGTITVKPNGKFNTYICKSSGSNTEFISSTISSLNKKYQFVSTTALSSSNIKIVFNHGADTPVMEQFVIELIRKI